MAEKHSSPDWFARVVAVVGTVVGIVLSILSLRLGYSNSRWQKEIQEETTAEKLLVRLDALRTVNNTLNTNFWPKKLFEFSFGGFFRQPAELTFSEAALEPSKKSLYGLEKRHEKFLDPGLIKRRAYPHRRQGTIATIAVAVVAYRFQVRSHKATGR